jgi:hypothetical protein
MVGEIDAAIQSNNQTFGMLVANFGQNFTGKNTGYTVLAPIDIKPVSSYTTGTPNTYAPVGNMIDIETMTHALGQQINMPIGLTTFNLQMWKDAFGVNGDANNVLIASSSTIQYYIIFQFELF